MIEEYDNHVIEMFQRVVNDGIIAMDGTKHWTLD